MPERRHEQDDVGLVDQRAQHQPRDHDARAGHHGMVRSGREEGAHALLVEADQVSAANTAMMPSAKLKRPRP